MNSRTLCERVCLLCIGCAVVTGCGSPLAIPEQEHLERYPETCPILVDMLAFTGILHDTQTGYYAFSYQATSQPKEHFSRLKCSYKENGWIPSAITDCSLLLTKEADSEVIYIEYASARNIYLFLRMSKDAWSDAMYRCKFEDIISRVTRCSWEVFTPET